MAIPTAVIIGAIYDLAPATFVPQWIVNFRCTAFITGRHTVVKFPIAANSSVRIIVDSTATSKTIRYIKDVALTTGELGWIIISVTTTA